jgi:uncharacterized protein DUF5825
MRTRIAGTGPQTVPETLTLAVESMLADPDAGPNLVAVADALPQPLCLAGPLGFDTLDTQGAHTALRFLTEATARLVRLDWTLAGEPPWPVRMLVHLVPPSRGTDPASRRYAQQWRQDHDFGLCTYRRGPDFVRMRDVRPGGPPRRILITGPWADTFDALTTGDSDERTEQLVDELVGAELALRLGDSVQVLPTRLRRWPTPHPDRR